MAQAGNILSMTKDVVARFDRVEAALEKMAEEHLAFRRTVKGAMAVQQEQIAGLTRNVAKHDAVIASLERQWQSYLSTIHP